MRVSNSEIRRACCWKPLSAASICACVEVVREVVVVVKWEAKAVVVVDRLCRSAIVVVRVEREERRA